MKLQNLNSQEFETKQENEKLLKVCVSKYMTYMYIYRQIK